jgi:formyltetrahydrofolate deformylase
MHRDRFYTLAASCPDRTGIIARVTSFIAEHRGWILESSFHADDEAGRYFMRLEIKADSLPFMLTEFRQRFAPIAQELEMDWKITDSAVKKRVVVLVSKQEHCLYDLLARWQSKELDIEIPCVISNHDTFKGFVEWHGIPFHHVPVTAENKAQAFAEIRRLYEESRGDTMVLARYMQILSPEMCQFLEGRAINIHHSFLPSFKGARPYHQAHERGVKLIGATAHYVTSDLDEGPIIEQDVARIDHSMTPDQLVAIGRDTECITLARAIQWHSEHRVLLNGHRTVVFR